MADVLARIDDWPVEHAAAAIVGPGTYTLHGDEERVFPLASVTKPLVAYAVLVAVEEQSLSLDDPVDPPGATVRHLLAHAAGYGFEYGSGIVAPVGRRRIYSNAGFEALGEALAARTAMPVADYLREAVLEPLGMRSAALTGPAGSGAEGSIADLARFGAELTAPRLIHQDTLREATSVQFPGLDGVLPGFGVQRPNDWGLGFELRDGKAPHWTGAQNSPETYGHFGASGTFLWIDPIAGVGCVALTDRPFDRWAVEAWPPFADAVLAR